MIVYSPGMEPPMHGPNKPVHPCRRMPTRHCPVIYQDVCGDRPCARFESEDEKPWALEIAGYQPDPFGGCERHPGQCGRSN